MESLSSTFSWLGSLGGGVALGFIVALALGIIAMSLLFLGSAVVVLEGFARNRQGWISQIAMLFLWWIVTSVYLAWQMGPELASRPEGAPPAILVATLSAAFAIFVCFVLASILLFFLRGRAMGYFALAWLGIGYALVVAGTGEWFLLRIPLTILRTYRAR